MDNTNEELEIEIGELKAEIVRLRSYLRSIYFLTRKSAVWWRRKLVHRPLSIEDKKIVYLSAEMALRVGEGNCG